MTKRTEVFNEVVFLRGSLIVLRRRCGKPTCRCAQGEPHETPALSYSVNGTTRMLTLRETDIREARAGLARYKKARLELDQQALAGILALRKQVAKAKARGRGTGQ